MPGGRRTSLGRKLEREKARGNRAQRVPVPARESPRERRRRLRRVREAAEQLDR
jgi:hypothetical protein